MSERIGQNCVTLTNQPALLSPAGVTREYAGGYLVHVKLATVATQPTSINVRSASTSRIKYVRMRNKFRLT